MTGIGWAVDDVAWVGQLEVMAPDELPDEELPDEDIVEPDELPDEDPEEPDVEGPPDAEDEPLEEASGAASALSLEDSEPLDPHALKSSGSQSERRRIVLLNPIACSGYQVVCNVPRVDTLSGISSPRVTFPRVSAGFHCRSTPEPRVTCGAGREDLTIDPCTDLGPVGVECLARQRANRLLYVPHLGYG
jgi:hypothetical protein